MTTVKSDQTRSHDRFGLPVDYVCNRSNLTREVDGVEYWTDRRIAYARSFQWHVYKWAGELVRLQGVGEVVDVGCGPATKLNEFMGPLGVSMVGIDQPSVIEYCRRTYSQGRYFADDFDSPSYPYRCTERALVMCVDVIEHLEDPDRLIGYLRNLGNDDSIYLLSTPDRVAAHGENCRHCPNPAHIREWSADEFVGYLSSRGFEILETRHLPPLRPAIDLLTAGTMLRQLLPRRSWKYNFAVLARPVAGSDNSG